MILSLLAFAGAMISVENPGIRLELFLKEVSKQTGQQLHCPTFLKDEVLAASFKDQSIDIVKSQLARVIHGTWEQKLDGWWLTQTSAQKKEEQKWNHDQRYELYQWEINRLKGYAPTKELTRAEVQKYYANRVTGKEIDGPNLSGIPSVPRRKVLNIMEPENRFQTRIAAQLKPDYFDFEGLTKGENRYTSQGLPGHIKIPINGAEPLASFLRESRLAVDIGVTEARQVSTVTNFEILVDSGEVPGLHITLYNHLWRYVDSCWASIELGAEDLIAEGEEFPLSPESRRRFDYLNLVNEARYDHSQDASLKANHEYETCARVMRQASQTDPLGLLQGICWVDFAKSQHKPLLVSLEEDVYQMRPARFVPKVEQLPMRVGMQRVDEDGWILGRPKNPLYNRTWRLDRSVVETFAKIVESPKFLTLENQLRIDDISRFAWSFAHGFPNAEFLIGFEGRGNGPFCILGTLSSEQLQSCIQGDRIPAEKLPERGRIYLQQLAAHGNLDELCPLIKKDEWSTPMYCLPNGIQGMSIGASETQVPVIALGDKPDAKCMHLYSYANKIRKAIQTNSSQLDEPIQLAYRTALTAEVHLGERVVTQTVDQPGEGERKACTWKTLPDSVRREVLERIGG